jgi:hypothetical protein
MAENGVLEAIRNIKDDVKEIFARVHSLEINGCAHKEAHESNYREFWKIYNENKKEVETKMNGQRQEIQEIKQNVTAIGTRIGIYVGIAAAAIGMLAQVLMRVVL